MNSDIIYKLHNLLLKYSSKEFSKDCGPFSFPLLLPVRGGQITTWAVNIYDVIDKF